MHGRIYVRTHYGYMDVWMHVSCARRGRDVTMLFAHTCDEQVAAYHISPR